MALWGSALDIRLGDYRRVVLCALEAVAHPVALLTITAPGVDAGLDSPDAIAAWNRSAAHRFGRLDRAAKGRLRREGLRVRPVVRIAQRQARGADHLHLVLLLEGELDRRSITAYVQALRDFGSAHGFGFVDDPFFARLNPTTGKRRDMVFDSAAVAGRYLVRYLTAKAGQLEALVAQGGHSFRPMWVAPQLTQASGVNMRRLRRVRHCWHLRLALEQGSRPRLPVWWGDLRERTAIMLLLRPAAAAAG
jgi:hypothetical protein